MGGGLEKARRRLLSRRRSSRVYRPGPFAPIYVALLLAGLVASDLVYSWLVRHVSGMATNRVDAIKTALLVIGGSGALAGLYVAYRKQRTDEANHLRDQDKLFTERYTAAVAQLGNPSAAVRLGGVYALARIADDSERDRPTCLKVLCAYLRMPYDPDDPSTEPAESQVRTAAQGTLAERLRPDHPGFWPNAEVDLSGAYLTNLRFNGIRVNTFWADQARFVGPDRYGGAAWFVEARFEGVTSFFGTRFEGSTWFRSVTFVGDAHFVGTTFAGYADFSKTTFGGAAQFAMATFKAAGGFNNATFAGDALFNSATFAGVAGFIGASFDGVVWFDEAEFSQNHPPVWPEGFDEPAGIVWIPADPPDPSPAADPNATALKKRRKSSGSASP